MIACVDIGNTNIVIGMMNDDKLLHVFRLETKKIRTEDEYGIKILDNLKYANINPADIKGAIIASVVPEVDATFAKAFKKYLKIEPLFVAPGIKTGIKIKLDNPRQLGADLLVGAVAATNKYGYPCAIIDMGTATTITVVNNMKELIGGIIYPGVLTAYDSLIKMTSLLEAARLEKPKKVIGNDTLTSLQSGMYFGTISALNGMLDKIISEVGPLKVILTGGISSVYENAIQGAIYDEHLLMDGLYYIYQKNN